MSWKCGTCGQREAETAEVDDRRFWIDLNAVCHHCGTPLCNVDPDGEPCQRWIDDDAFRVEEGGRRRACHCRACLESHHPGAGLVDPPDELRPRRADT